jgi:hypothetical protein
MTHEQRSQENAHQSQARVAPVTLAASLTVVLVLLTGAADAGINSDRQNPRPGPFPSGGL